VKTHHIAAFGLSIALVALAGCEPQQPPPIGEATDGSTVDRLTQEMDRAVDRADDIAREKGSRLIDEARERLARWRKQLEDAEVREDLSQDARARFASARDKLREDLRNLEERLEELRGRGAAAWTEAAPEFRRAMDNLGDSFREFRTTFLRREDAPPADAPPPADPP
jgi:septal ring factor EnvC (AmiA/AmiB activator)